MKRLFKSWTGRHSPSPRKSRPSRRHRTSKRSDERDHGQSIDAPQLVPLAFLGYQQLPDGSLHPVYSPAQPAVYQTVLGQNAGSSNANLLDAQHFCFRCGKARSKRYHMDNPIKPGSTAPPASCCTKCRRKTFGSEPWLKYQQHFCADCGKVRSRSYHDEHPVPDGQKPRPSRCARCRARRDEEADEESDWEDLDPDDTMRAQPRLKTSASARFARKKDESITPSDSAEDEESEGFVKPRHSCPTLSGSSKMSVSPRRRRTVCKNKLRKARSSQSWVEDAPPTPPKPLGASRQQHQPEKNHDLDKGSVASAPVQNVTQVAGSSSDAVPPTSSNTENCQKHVHVVYIQPSCHHQHHDDTDRSSQDATKVGSSRSRRADSYTTTASSKQSSRRVVFATPEVSSRHEADSDYDRSAVPENHEDPMDFGLNRDTRQSNFDPRGSNIDGLRHQSSSTSGPLPQVPESSSGRSSSEYASTPDTGSSGPRIDTRSPPPEYSGPPPKVFSPDEIRRLWEQGPQPVRPPRRPRSHAAESENNAPVFPRDVTSLNRENFFANQRSASEGDHPRGYGDGFDGFRPSRSTGGSSRLDTLGPNDFGRSNDRSASDSRYKNDENIDPKTRYSSSRSDQSRGQNDPSQQSANTNSNNQSSGPNNMRPTQSHGTGSTMNNLPMYNNVEDDEDDNAHAGPGASRSREYNRNMYSNHRNASSNARSSRSRTASSQSRNENNNMYNNNRTHDRTRTRQSESSQARGSAQNNSRQSSTSAPASANEAPFTARERMWTAGPEEARKLREAMERLERAAAAASTMTAAAPGSPPTPDIRVNGSPVHDFFDVPGSTHDSASGKPMFTSSSADFGRSKPDFASTRDFNSAHFDPTKHDFASTGAFASSFADFGSTKPDFRSTKPDFTSDTRNFSSSTRRDFSPNVPEDFVPPRPSGFAPKSPPRFSHQRSASATTTTWKHPCGPVCNEFCPQMHQDHVVDREIVEIDSDEEQEILGVKRKKPSIESLASDRAFRLALVRLPQRQPVVEGAESLARSDYYTASESSDA